MFGCFWGLVSCGVACGVVAGRFFGGRGVVVLPKMIIAVRLGICGCGLWSGGRRGRCQGYPAVFSWLLVVHIYKRIVFCLRLGLIFPPFS